jgi:hypothetical protein
MLIFVAQKICQGTTSSMFDSREPQVCVTSHNYLLLSSLFTLIYVGYTFSLQVFFYHVMISCVWELWFLQLYSPVIHDFWSGFASSPLFSDLDRYDSLFTCVIPIQILVTGGDIRLFDSWFFCDLWMRGPVLMIWVSWTKCWSFGMWSGTWDCVPDHFGDRG